MGRHEGREAHMPLDDVVNIDAYDTPQSLPQPLPLPCRRSGLHLIIDFDNTITKQDTTLNIGEIALSYKLRSLDTDQHAEWESFLQWYANTLGTYTASYSPKPGTLKEEIIWLRSLRHVEEQSHRSRSLRDVLRDVPAERYRAAAYESTQEIPWRESFLVLMAELRLGETGGGEKRLLCNVLSVSWSEDFIHGFLAGMLARSEKGAPRKPDTKTPRQRGAAALEAMQIWANRIEPQTGMIVPGSHAGVPEAGAERVLSSCVDKLRVMAGKMLQCGMKTVYVGDSTTDLECLLGAHVGVVMTEGGGGGGGGGGGSLMERLRSIGYPCDRLSERQPGYEESGLPRKLWWVADFVELVPLIREADVPVTGVMVNRQ